MNVEGLPKTRRGGSPKIGSKRVVISEAPKGASDVGRRTSLISRRHRHVYVFFPYLKAFFFFLNKN